jgi:hypothetical protein
MRSKHTRTAFFGLVILLLAAIQISILWITNDDIHGVPSISSLGNIQQQKVVPNSNQQEMKQYTENITILYHVPVSGFMGKHMLVSRIFAKFCEFIIICRDLKYFVLYQRILSLYGDYKVIFFKRCQGSVAEGTVESIGDLLWTSF